MRGSGQRGRVATLEVLCDMTLSGGFSKQMMRLRLSGRTFRQKKTVRIKPGKWSMLACSRKSTEARVPGAESLRSKMVGY